MIKIVRSSAAILSLVLVWSPGSSAWAAKLPKILQEIEKKYSEAGSLSAHFSQTNEIASMGQTKKSSGVVMLKRPDKLRWETQKPDTNLLVSDGKTYWFYTPPFDEGEHGQVIEKKTSEVQSKLASALLSGEFSKTRDMKIQALKGNQFALIPKPGSAGTVMRAEIQVDPDRKVIQKVMLQHRGGNKSEISLTEIELGKKLEEETFNFKIPPNTDKVNP